MLEKPTIDKKFPLKSQIDRFHISYSFAYDGYFLYVRYSELIVELFGWAFKFAGKLPYRRMNSVPYKSEDEAWKELERLATIKGAWHAVGYARAMRQELCRLEGRRYSELYISKYDLGFRGLRNAVNIPGWIDETYLVGEQYNPEDLKLRHMLEAQMAQKRLKSMALAEHATSARAGDVMVDGIIYSFESFESGLIPPSGKQNIVRK